LNIQLYQKKSTQFLALTSLRVKEFETLLVDFNLTCENIFGIIHLKVKSGKAKNQKSMATQNFKVQSKNCFS
jgi:hypothetical protein